VLFCEAVLPREQTEPHPVSVAHDTFLPTANAHSEPGQKCPHKFPAALFHSIIRQILLLNITIVAFLPIDSSAHFAALAGLR
jgi:hypothetical protein